MSSSSSDPRVLAECSGARTHEKRDCTVRGESETVEVVVVVVVVRAHLWARGKKRRLSAFVSSLPRAERSTAEPVRFIACSPPPRFAYARYLIAEI